MSAVDLIICDIAEQTLSRCNLCLVGVCNVHILCLLLIVIAWSYVDSINLSALNYGEI